MEEEGDYNTSPEDKETLPVPNKPYGFCGR